MIIGTRESELAMKQTSIFIEALRARCPELEVDIKSMKSSGDIDLKSSLDKLQGFGAFVRELDAALLRGSIDVSVNSMKDMPIDTPEGLCVPAVLPRASVEDVMIPCGIQELKKGAVVGTSSIRRSALIKSIRPDVTTSLLRGNVRTRVSKLDNGDYDAIVLAKAGIERLGIERPMVSMNPKEFIPAPAQGVIAIVSRSDDEETNKILRMLDDPITRMEVTVERRLMKLMGAGCSSPIGINVKYLGNKMELNAISFEFTDEPVRVNTFIPLDYQESMLKNISLILKGESI